MKKRFIVFLDFKHIFIIKGGYNNRRQVKLTDFMVVESFNNHNFLSQHFIDNLICALFYLRSVYFVKLNFFYNKRIAEKKGIKNMYKILVADDEQKIREVIKEYAEYEGHTVYEAVDGMQAVDMAKEQDFDIIIMDVMMPRLDGFSACKEIRKFKNTPILMLSARTEEYDKLFGFEMGVDDYVVKPFSPKEVLARINAIIKRNKSGNEPVGETVKFEGLEINFTARDVFIDGEKANLTPKEYDLLFYLVKNKNIALTRNKLLEEVWGYDFFGDDRTIDTHIKMLRNNLGPYRKFIVTLRGMGYKFQV